MHERDKQTDVSGCAGVARASQTGRNKEETAHICHAAAPRGGRRDSMPSVVRLSVPSASALPCPALRALAKAPQRPAFSGSCLRQRLTFSADMTHAL